MSKINKILNSIKLNKSETDINKLINQNLKIKDIINNYQNINNVDYSNKLKLLQIKPNDDVIKKYIKEVIDLTDK